jgi:Zn-dependent peptidase ImmA (M78 family)
VRRGFKTEAAGVSADIRRELGISPLDPLNPWALADLLDIPVWALSTYPDNARQCVTTLTGQEHGSFHGMIAFVGSRQVIVHNDANALTRQRSDLAHELAHALLLHQPHQPVQGRPLSYDREQEDEAAWLGGVLLVSEDACLHACRNQQSVEEAASALGVSKKMMDWRIGATGARKRVERQRSRRPA